MKWHAQKMLSTSRLSTVSAVLTFFVPIYAAAELLVSARYNISLPHPVNLLAAYFGALLYSVANYSHSFFCPRIIRDYPSKYMFIEDCVSQSHDVWNYLQAIEQKQIQITGSSDNRDQVDLEDTIKKMMQYEMERVALPKLKDLWDERDSNQVFIRRLIGGTYVLSIAIFGWLTFYDAPSRVIKALA
jgi:hypothetical protein